MSGVVLGLGSNRHFKKMPPIEILSQACTLLSAFLTDISVSGIYRTQAMYLTDQEDFYNGVLKGDFKGTPHELLVKIHEVERKLGRNRSREVRNGPRSLDVDIEFFADCTVNTKTLIIPHPRMEERAFVIAPLLDILQECADVRNRGIEFYEKRLSELADQRVGRVLTKEQFANLVSQNAQS